MISKRSGYLPIISILFAACCHLPAHAQTHAALATAILHDHSLTRVKHMALELLKSGFNAGSGYGSVWIRDLNTFIVPASEVHPKAAKKCLRVFFQMQGTDGDIIDGYEPKSKANGSYHYIYSKNSPAYAGHKNTVETDQETSLVQAVYKYVKTTHDTAFLHEKIDEKTVKARMADALDFLMTKRYAPKYGLIYGATTVDWGDVQPETPWGVTMGDRSHLAIDIYDNAMLVVALNDYLKLFPANYHWKSTRNRIRKNIKKHLWDPSHKKFIPHIYLRGSPFPASFNENKIDYDGGTAIAIQAGLLNKKQIETVNAKMLRDVRVSGAKSIGLTVYPPYPNEFFKNKSMRPYGYQNGGDWTWFGARMITQLVRYGFVQKGYQEIQPMIRRVIANKGFYEWYKRNGKPVGSANYRGSAGALFTAITALRIWARAHSSSPSHATRSSSR